MITQPLKQQVKSPRLMLFYIGLVSTVQLTLHIICFPFFTLESLQFLKTITLVSLWTMTIFGFMTWCKGPGFISKEPDVAQTELLERFNASELCFECGVIALPRSYHCNVCKRCVERYDHHCPWLNSCIGTGNHSYFLVFVAS
jgi:hypothetical protein